MSARPAAAVPRAPVAGRAGAVAAPRRSFGSAARARPSSAPLLPGTAFLAAGRRRLGAVTLLRLPAPRRRRASGWRPADGGPPSALAVDTDWLLWIVGGHRRASRCCGWWSIVAGYRMLLPRPARPRGRHVLGAARRRAARARPSRAPAVLAGRLALAQRDLIAGVFADDGESATVVDTPDPFGDQGAGQRPAARRRRRRGPRRRPHRHRHRGQHRHRDRRHDAVQPAAQPRGPAVPGRQPAGRGLPRRLRRRQREREPAQRRLPQRPGRSTPTSSARPTTRARTSSSSASARRSASTIDYYVLVNLDGFSRLVDALGGITVNVNYYVPIGGDPGTGSLPDDYIAPGPDQQHRRRHGAGTSPAAGSGSPTTTAWPASAARSTRSSTPPTR